MAGHDDLQRVRADGHLLVRPEVAARVLALGQVQGALQLHRVSRALGPQLKTAQ